MGLSDLGEAAAVDVVTTVTEVTEDHLVLVSRILNKKPVHVIVFHLVEMIQLANVSYPLIRQHGLGPFLPWLEVFEKKLYANDREQWQLHRQLLLVRYLKQTNQIFHHC
jgi:hypothetical protein